MQLDAVFVAHPDESSSQMSVRKHSSGGEQRVDIAVAKAPQKLMSDRIAYAFRKRSAEIVEVYPVAQAKKAAAQKE